MNAPAATISAARSPSNRPERKVREKIAIWKPPFPTDQKYIEIKFAASAGRHGSADGLRLVGAVDAIHCGAEIKRARPHRIAGPARHEARQIRLTLDHLRRRRPVGPFLLAGDLQKPLPLKALASDADAIAQRAAVTLHDIKNALGGRDDDRARSFGGAIAHRGALEFWRELFFCCARHVAGLITVDILRWIVALRGSGGGRQSGKRREAGGKGKQPGCDHLMKLRMVTAIKSDRCDAGKPPGGRISFVQILEVPTTISHCNLLPVRSDPEPQDIRNQPNGADAARPERHEPDQPSREWPRGLFGLGQW